MPEDSEQDFSGILIPPRLDTVTVTEYERAIERLKQFSQADISSVTNLNGTDEITSRFHVGSSFRAIAITHGTPIEGVEDSIHIAGKTERRIRLPAYSLVRDVGDQQLALILSARPTRYPELPIQPGSNFRNDIEYCSIGFGDNPTGAPMFLDRLGYSVDIPTNISLGLARQLEPDTISAFERVRLGNKVDEIRFYPVFHPHNSSTQQGYVGYLQRAARAVLSLNLPPPTPVPAAFMY